MRRTISILFALFLATGFVLPLAQANWKFRGTNEPDTLRDSEDGLMWADPDTSSDAGHRAVYFNVFGKLTSELAYNANVAATGSRMQPPDTSFTGFLGVWKDCDKDGYIGKSEYGLFEYRAELLLGDTSVCPVGAIPAANDEAAWYPHNDGVWVREFIFIGKKENGDANSFSTNPTVHKMQGTNIWGDWGLPEDEARIVCPLGGNLGTRSTGAMLDWADCLFGYRTMDTLNGVQDATGLPVGGWNKKDAEHSPAFLNMPNPAYTTLYGPNQDGRAGVMGRDDRNSNYQATPVYETYDCNSSTVAGRPGPSGSTQVNPSGSVYETANDTYNVARLGKCKSATDEGLFYTRIDGSNEATQPYRGKVSADHVFLFSWGSRKTVPSVNPAVDAIIGRYPPTDGGLAAERGDGPVGPAWRTNPSITTGPQVVNRADLELASANYMTFYARLGSTTGILTPSSAALTYGSPSCGTNIGPNAGIQNGWNCDPAAWRTDCSSQNPPTLTAQCHEVGETYHLRDIDCWDGQIVRKTPLYASTTWLSEKGPCEVSDNEKMIS